MQSPWCRGADGLRMSGTGLTGTSRLYFVHFLSLFPSILFFFLCHTLHTPHPPTPGLHCIFSLSQYFPPLILLFRPLSSLRLFTWLFLSSFHRVDMNNQQPCGERLKCCFASEVVNSKMMSDVLRAALWKSKLWTKKWKFKKKGNKLPFHLRKKRSQMSTTYF